MLPNSVQVTLITEVSSVVVAEGGDVTHTIIEVEVISTGNKNITTSNVGTEISNQPWDHILDSVNPVTYAVPKSQPAQPDNTQALVYGSMAEVWPYGLLPAGHMRKRVRVPCVYNSPPWGIL